jgi:crotonobetainyl-CoA:carnitine CoA-transferase CaiB-like acyl-CoA transferase
VSAPLAGVTVLDMGTLTPGKYCSCLLADIGAEVVRIERPAPSREVSDEDLALNQGKRSMTLNLRSEAGREVFLRLASAADVILESNRPGSADRNGVGYQAVQAHNPRVVYCALSGYGASGPQSQAPGYDLIFAAQCGMLAALTGEQARPVPPGTYLADGVSGLTAAYAVVVALLAREREGRGAYLDLAMHDSLFALLAVSHGVKRPGDYRPGSPPHTPTYAVYPAAEGTWLALGAIRPASIRALFAHLGRADLAEGDADPAAVEGFLANAFLAKTARDWVAELAPLDVEAAPVNAPLDAYDDPQLRVRGMIDRVSHPDAGAIETIGPALVLDRSLPRAPKAPAPRVGADTEAILREMGYESEAIADLRRRGVV